MGTKLRSLARNVIYALKRSYPTPVDFYHQTGETTDWTTGAATTTVVKYHIERAVALPEDDMYKNVLAQQVARVVKNDGALIEFGLRQLLVDNRDLTVPLGIENWYAIISGTRYQISRITDYGSGAGSIVTLREDGGRRDAQVDVKLHDLPLLGQEAEGEL